MAKKRTMFDFVRNWTKSAADRQQEAISAYLDGVLAPAERQRFEQQMAQDAALQAEVEQQRQTRQLLRQLLPRQVPRNFTLDPAVYGRPARQPLVTYYPALRAATVLTAVLFFFAIGLNLFGSRSGSMAPAPDTAVSQLTSATTTEESEGVAGSVAEMDEGQMDEPSAANAPPAEPEAMAEEEAVTEEEAESESAADSAEGESTAEEAPAPAVPEAGVATTALPPATPSPMATMDANMLAEPLPTATVSGLPRVSATVTVAADRNFQIVPAASPSPGASVSDDGTAVAQMESPAIGADTAVTSQAQEPGEPLDFLFVVQIGLLLLLITLVVLTLYARRRQL